MTDVAVREQKMALRRTVLAERAALTVDARQVASARVCDHLAEVPQVMASRALIAYAAFGAEANIDPLLAALIERGAGVLLPWVEGAELRLARVRDLEADLAPGWRGVREPRMSGRRPARADRVDLVLTPLVAFDDRGRRLGYGGGHFDRLLARVAPGTTVIGVAYAMQQCAVIPTETHDVPLDLVVTDDGVLQPGQS